jgi:hypothetical protein
MTKIKYILLLLVVPILLLFMFNCKKDIGKLQKENNVLNDTNLNIPVSTSTFVCEDTTHIYSSFYIDEFANFIQPYGKKSVWRVLYDLNDKDVIYYLTNELGKKMYTLWRYSLKDKIKVHLADNLLGNLEINKQGWIVYDSFSDWNLYKIKSNGDSLTQLTFDGCSKFPKWSDDGNSIWFVNDGPKIGGVFKINPAGIRLDTLKNASSWVVQKNNYLYYLKYDGVVFKLIQRNSYSSFERIVLTISDKNLEGNDIWDYFESQDGQFIYWWGAHGLSKTNLTTLLSQRIINGSPKSLNSFLHYRQNPITKRFLCIQRFQVPINIYKVDCYNKIIEFTEDGTCMRTIEIPE